MTCQRFEEDLVGYAAGEIGGEDRSRLLDHLRECTGCRAELAELKHTWRELAASAEVPDPGPEFWDSFPARVFGAYTYASAPVGWKVRLLDALGLRGQAVARWAAVGALSCCLVVGGILLADRGQTSATRSGGSQAGPKAAFAAPTRPSMPTTRLASGSSSNGELQVAGIGSAITSLDLQGLSPDQVGSVSQGIHDAFLGNGQQDRSSISPTSGGADDLGDLGDALIGGSSGDGDDPVADTGLVDDLED